MQTTLKLPTADPLPKPTRSEQIGAQICWQLLGGVPLTGWAATNAAIILPLNNYPGSGNQSALRRVARYGAAVRSGKYLQEARSGCSFLFSAQADPKSGFLNLVNRCEYSRGHLGLWMLAAGTAWVVATQEDKGQWADDIADQSWYWWSRLFGNLDWLSYHGIVLGPGWRDEADLESKNDDTLKFLHDGVKPKRRPKEWTNLTAGGYSVLYQLWTLLVLQDLCLMRPPKFAKMPPDPTGLPIKVYSTPQFPYINEVERITPRKEIMRWAYRVDRVGDIWVQKQINPTTVTRPSEKDCPFVKVGKIGKEQ